MREPQSRAMPTLNRRDCLAVLGALAVEQAGDEVAPDSPVSR